MKKTLYFVFCLIQNLNNINGMDEIKKCKPVKKEKNSKANLIENTKQRFIEEGERFFINGDLESLDPLVGDTQCHIRALMMAEKYNDFIAKKQQDIDVQLTEEEKIFLGFCNLLTKTKEFDFMFNLVTEEKINPLLLNPELSGNESKKIILECQRIIADQSVEYMKKIAQDFKDLELSKIINYIVFDDKVFKRPHIACYPRN